MKYLITLLITCCFCISAWSQQRAQFSQYMQNNYLINPAVAGIESYADARFGYRTQWTGVEGAPQTFYASIHTALNKNDRNALPLKILNRNAGGPKTNANRNNRFHVSPHHGVGAIAQMDKAGLLRTASLNLSYAYHLPLTNRINLSSGIYSGLLQMNINRDAAVMQTPDDPFLYAEGVNILKLDLGVGLWLYSPDFFVGVSGAQLVKSGNDVYASGDGPRATMQPHYFATGGYRVNVLDNLSFTPSVLLKLAPSTGQTAVDLNIKTIYLQRFWAGLSYRQKDAAAVMAGIHISHLLDVSYSYDFATSDMSKVNANSQEVVLGIKLNNPSKVICPKWIW
ncbi:type IX secretion system membrane protein PorP/SprF [Pontibacter qinzhouensis]|uniref:Type IX secretion system membrane protein PorP/SprF n=1 Tax=Pontibacter qinzhouensis TaxID=2603253 RepID=A0A5C8JAT7_9BACT|nr:type IX secretion system membrane protein PorP/SprF [Pontibacter qinzhouensis]TXK33797.1 type IX secretion system membrane protein PorP/SprF [Pontibacter qinzhouensis]